MFETFNYKKGENEDQVNSQNIESLTQPEIEEIHLPNLNVSDLMMISEISEIKERILSASYQEAQNFQTKTEIFLEEISKAYSDDELEKTALYHILIGTDIPETVEELDLEGDYSIQDFIKQFALQSSSFDK